MIAKLGICTKRAQMDTKSAFRLLPIYPGDFDIFGFQLNGKYYTDEYLSMLGGN